MKGRKSDNPYTMDELNAFFKEIREKRDRFCKENHLTVDDVWVLVDGRIHEGLLKHPFRVSEGPDKITHQCLLGMHAIHDLVNHIWIIPKKKPPREYFDHWRRQA